MGLDTNPIDNWSKKFNQIFEGLRKTHSTVKSLTQFIRKEWITKEMYPQLLLPKVYKALATIDRELEKVEEASNNLKCYFCSNPAEKWLTGQKLTREEFYLLVTQGFITIHPGPGSEDAYEKYTYYYYEDNKNRGYINPKEHPDPPRVPTINGGWHQTIHTKFGIVPEEVRTSYLMPDQLLYFKDFKPKLFSRFIKD